MDFEMTTPTQRKVQAKPTAKRTDIFVQDGKRVAKREWKRNYKATRKHHKLAIKAELRKIKAHKLLIKQAKTAYKVKMIGA